MKNVHIKACIRSETEESSITDTYGEYNEEENIITYMDKNVSVRVIIGEKISIERKNEDYNINIIFDENNKSNSIYQIYNPEMTLNLEVETLLLKRENNAIYLEYRLNINKEDIGIFIVDLKWEEQNEY